MHAMTRTCRWCPALALLLLVGCQGEGCDSQAIEVGGDYQFPRDQALENALTLVLTQEGLQTIQQQAIAIAAQLLEASDYHFDLSEFVTEYLEQHPITVFDYSARDIEVVLYLPDGTDSLELTVLADPTRIRVHISRLWISIWATVYDDEGEVTAACRIAPNADVGILEPFSLVLENTEFEIALGTTPDGHLDLSTELTDLGLVQTGVSVITDSFHPDYYCNLEECLDGCGECHIFCTGMEILIEVGEFFVALFEDLLDDVLELITNILLEQLELIEGRIHPALIAGDAVPPLYDAHWLGFLLGPGGGGFVALPIEGVPTSLANDLLLGMAAGLESDAHPCIGKDLSDPAWSPPVPYELEADDLDPHIVLALADTLIDQAVWGAYKSGSMCLLLQSGLISRFTDRFNLSAGLLSLLLPGLDRIAAPDAPLLISIQPALDASAFPLVQLERSQDGETLIGFALDAVDIGFYAWVQGRYLRLFEVRTAVSIQVVPTLLPDNQLEIAIADLGATLIEQRYNELFSAVDLVGLVNFALELATATLIESGQGITLSITDLVQGATGLPIVPRVLRFGASAANPHWLELLLALELPEEKSLAPDPVQTELTVHSISPGEVTLEVSAAGLAQDQIEYQARWGFGPWTDFRQGGEGTLSSSFLLFPGEQLLEVRARARDDYRTLDLSPATASIDVPVWEQMPRPAEPRFTSEARNTDTSERQTGCTLAPPNPPFVWLVIAFLLLLRRMIGRAGPTESRESGQVDRP
ncbi:MAG: hypothetical protein JW797_01580 [Bradymonadales bacterium]|nr:hypothetical protein [Bradymonadales bacterium]